MDYDAIPALNWSTLRYMAVSAKLLRWRVDYPAPQSAAMAIGRAIHAALLDPKEWSRYVCEPVFGDRTKETRALRAEWRASNSDKIILSAGDYQMVQAACDAVMGHRIAAKLLAACRKEQVIQWTDAETGIACKGRVDGIERRIVELKTTSRATPSAYLIDAARRLYHGQWAWYHDGAIAAGLLDRDAEYPVVVTVQTVEPYDVAVYQVEEDEEYFAGRACYRSLLRKYAACVAANWWPGMCPETLRYWIPAWATSETEEE